MVLRVHLVPPSPLTSDTQTVGRLPDPETGKVHPTCDDVSVHLISTVDSGAPSVRHPCALSTEVPTSGRRVEASNPSHRGQYHATAQRHGQRQTAPSSTWPRGRRLVPRQRGRNAAPNAISPRLWPARTPSRRGLISRAGYLPKHRNEGAPARHAVHGVRSCGRSDPRPGHGSPSCRFNPSWQRTRRRTRFPCCRPGRRSR